MTNPHTFTYRGVNISINTKGMTKKQVAHEVKLAKANLDNRLGEKANVKSGS